MDQDINFDYVGTPKSIDPLPHIKDFIQQKTTKNIWGIWTKSNYYKRNL